MAATSSIRPWRPSSARRRSGASDAALWLAAVCASVSCGSPSTSSGQPVTMQLIGDPTLGGTATSPNGRLKVQVPPGALSAPLTITIATDPAVVGTVGPVYEIGPTGTQFMHPVTLSLRFTTADLAGGAATSLKIATLLKGNWVPIASSVDLGASVVTGQITHLSPWSLISDDAVVPPAPDAGGTSGTDGADAAAGSTGAAGASGGEGGRRVARVAAASRATVERARPAAAARAQPPECRAAVVVLVRRVMRAAPAEARAARGRTARPGSRARPARAAQQAPRAKAARAVPSQTPRPTRTPRPTFPRTPTPRTPTPPDDRAPRLPLTRAPQVRTLRAWSSRI